MSHIHIVHIPSWNVRTSTIIHLLLNFLHDDALEKIGSSLYKMCMNFYWFKQEKIFSPEEKSGGAPFGCALAASMIRAFQLHFQRQPSLHVCVYSLSEEALNLLAE